MKAQRLSRPERAELRARLTARAAELRAEVREGLHPPGLESGDTPLDDVAIASVSRDTAELTRIGDALARIDAPDFGYCVDCGVGIAIQRLMAEPDAIRCMRCQDRADRRS